MTSLIKVYTKVSKVLLSSKKKSQQHADSFFVHNLQLYV